MMVDMNPAPSEYTTKNTGSPVSLRHTYALCATAYVSHSPNAALYSIGTDATVS